MIRRMPSGALRETHHPRDGAARPWTSRAWTWTRVRSMRNTRARRIHPRTRSRRLSSPLASPTRRRRRTRAYSRAASGREPSDRRSTSACVRGP